MKKQALIFRFKRYMAKENWKKTKTGYSSGIVAGVLNGLSLMILLPAIVSLAENRSVLGLSFWNWILILLVVGILSIILDFVGQRVSYIGGLGF
ncbi:MAG: ABC transporter ATP-binding protein, partial [Christensenellaceae bacterium]|nr:ABC transporter ATP-binding protein [Christensenellaceae bacterium]